MKAPTDIWKVVGWEFRFDKLDPSPTEGNTRGLVVDYFGDDRRLKSFHVESLDKNDLKTWRSKGSVTIAVCVQQHQVGWSIVGKQDKYPLVRCSVCGCQFNCDQTGTIVDTGARYLGNYQKTYQVLANMLKPWPSSSSSSH